MFLFVCFGFGSGGNGFYSCFSVLFFFFNNMEKNENATTNVIISRSMRNYLEG